MAIIQLPTGLLCGQFAISQRRFDMDEMSEESGDALARLLGPPRWGLVLAAPSNGLSQANAALWSSMVLRLRGRVNHLAAYDIVKQAPRGSFRGNPTLVGAHAGGLSTLVINGGSGQAGQTFLSGDWVGVGSGLGSQVVNVVADAVANGSGQVTLTVEPPLRLAWPNGTAIVWDKPLIYYKAVSQAVSWDYRPGWNTLRGFQGEFVEQWNA